MEMARSCNLTHDLSQCSYTFKVQWKLETRSLFINLSDVSGQEYEAWLINYPFLTRRHKPPHSSLELIHGPNPPGVSYPNDSGSCNRDNPFRLISRKSPREQRSRSSRIAASVDGFPAFEIYVPVGNRRYPAIPTLGNRAIL
jgi:hypothetical protein